MYVCIMYPGNDGVTSRDFQSTFLYECKIIFYAYISLMCSLFVILINMFTWYNLPLCFTHNRMMRIFLF